MNSDSRTSLKFHLIRSVAIIVLMFSLAYGLLEAFRFPETDVLLLSISALLYLSSIGSLVFLCNVKNRSLFIIYMLIMPLVTVYEPWRPFGAIAMLLVASLLAGLWRENA